MTKAELRQAVLSSLARVAPEIRPADVRPAENLRDQLDIDSMDFLNFIIALHERLGVAIPEADYRHLLTLDGAVDYLAARVPPHPAG